MTTNEAIEKLEDMQSQIIHGSRIFGDIADVIRAQQTEIGLLANKITELQGTASANFVFDNPLEKQFKPFLPGVDNK